jgi:hypothetical protein
MPSAIMSDTHTRTLLQLLRQAPLLPGVENADEAGVHDADEDSGEPDTVVGEVSLSSARCRTDA